MQLQIRLLAMYGFMTWWFFSQLTIWYADYHLMICKIKIKVSLGISILFYITFCREFRVNFYSRLSGLKLLAKNYRIFSAHFGF